MKLKQIEHIGIAVESIDKALPYWEGVLGLKCYNIEEVADQKVRTAFLRLGEVKIELLEPTSPESPVAKFLEKRGAGFHHLAYGVENIESALEEAEKAGMQLLDRQPRKGAEGLSIAFLHPKSTGGVLTEFCEDKNR